MAFSPEIFSDINEIVSEDVKQELRLQGHYAFGELESSFKLFNLFIASSIILEAQSLGYIKELEEGVPASKINISPAEFQKIVNWVQLRGMAKGIKDARQVAYFIIRKWKQEGKPLETSKQFSETGDILNAVKITFEAWREKYEIAFNQRISQVFTSYLKSRVKSVTI